MRCVESLHRMQSLLYRMQSLLYRMQSLLHRMQSPGLSNACMLSISGRGAHDRLFSAATGRVLPQSLSGRANRRRRSLSARSLLVTCCQRVNPWPKHAMRACNANGTLPSCSLLLPCLLLPCSHDACTRKTSIYLHDALSFV